MVLRERDGIRIRIQGGDLFRYEHRTSQLKLHRGFPGAKTRESLRAAATNSPTEDLTKEQTVGLTHSLGGRVQGVALLRVRPYLSDGDA